MPAKTERGPKRKTEARQTRLSVPADLKGPKGIDVQPVNDVTWVSRAAVQANDYNPNHVAPPEMRLLKISLLTDGWTQPLVVRRVGNDAYELVDGYHRWLASDDKRISLMTDGKVPISILAEKPLEDRMMSTIRHNRARGEHVVLDMAKIALQLLESGMSESRVGDMLQMDAEEVRRLKEFGNMRLRGATDDGGFGRGWKPA